MSWLMSSVYRHSGNRRCRIKNSLNFWRLLKNSYIQRLKKLAQRNHPQILMKREIECHAAAKKSKINFLEGLHHTGQSH